MIGIVPYILLVAFAVSTTASPVAKPAITAAPDLKLAKRASCTFSGSNGASLASKSKTSCATIVLSNVAVPSGTTLDLSGLSSGTSVRASWPTPPTRCLISADTLQVIFEGQTSWGYKEWSGPLLQIGGTNIKVSGASGATLNPDGARWWDGQGGSGGKTKPKFFAAHSLTTSSITDLHILNTPIQAVSIDDCNGLTITGMTIDNSAGDSAGGHNTDGFDIGSSSSVTITGATVYNQDDCVAVNSGTVRIIFSEKNHLSLIPGLEYYIR